MTAALRKLRSSLTPGPRRSGSFRAIDVAARLSSNEVALAWLVRLRWHSVIAQAVAAWAAAFWGLLPMPPFALLTVVVVLALSNAALSAWARSARSVTQAAIASVLLADTALLTCALALAGGPGNPLVALYVVEVMLAALLLDKVWVAALVLASSAGHACLLLLPTVPLKVQPHPAATLTAIALTLGISGALAARVVAAFRERQRLLANAEREAAQAEKLASLTTLAAGAAHELATPLGTIAVAATELDTLIATAPAEAVVEARLIREQVERCKRILQRLGTRAGGTLGELPRRTRAGELFELVRRELGSASTRLETDGDMELTLEAPAESLAAVLANLVTNGLQASPEHATVTLTVTASAGNVRFTVIDGGAGIPASVLPRLGEPFFTTKAPGEGLGLGLFLAFRFTKACHGQLGIESVEGSGSRVHVQLPAVKAA